MKPQNRHRLFGIGICCFVALWLGTHSLQAQTHAANPLDFEFATNSDPIRPLHVDLHPFVAAVPNMLEGKFFAGAALQVSRHELGYGYQFSSAEKLGSMLNYRYYLLPNQWRCQPFVGAYFTSARMTPYLYYGVPALTRQLAGGLSLGQNWASRLGCRCSCRIAWVSWGYRCRRSIFGRILGRA